MRFYVLAVLFAIGCGKGEDTDEGTGTTPTDPTADDDGTDTDEPTDTDLGTDTPTPTPTESVDPATLEGKTYVVDLASGTFVEPYGVGPLIQTQITTEILVGVVAATDADLQLRGSIADTSGGQDMCMATIEFPTADFSGNPSFEVGPESLSLDVSGIAVEIEDLVLAGAFAASGDQIVGATLAGSIDTRPLVSLIGETDPNAICDMLVMFGASCVACSDGSGDYCIDVLVTNLTADLLPGVSLIEITQATVDADPACY